jgi:hypothetical protein
MVHGGRLVHDRRLCDDRRIRYNWFMVSGHVRDCRRLWLTDRSRLGDCGGIRHSGNWNLNSLGSLNRFGGVLSGTLLLHGFCVLSDAFDGWINLLNGDFFLSDDRLNSLDCLHGPHALNNRFGLNRFGWGRRRRLHDAFRLLRHRRRRLYLR